MKHIYITTVQDFHSYFQKKQITDNQYLYGIIQKYWPMIESINDISNQETNEEMYQALVNDLADEDSRIRIINQELPMIVQSLSKVEKLYNSISKQVLER